MSRFAILRHQMGENSKRPLHWDLMFEAGEVLRTFACPSEPTAGLSLQVEQLSDHRPEYLDYEGPVSRGRGDVTQWDRGDFDVVADGPGHWLLDVRGRQWNGRVRFTAVADQRWTVTWEEPASD